MFDDTLLGDPRALAALDTGGVLRSAATAGAQVRSAAHGAAEAGVGELAGGRPRSLVLLRRPGVSGSAAELLRALLGPVSPIPVLTSDDGARLDRPAGRGGRAHRRPGRHRAGRERAAGGAAAEPRWCSPLRPTARWPRPGAGRARLVEPRIPVPPGLDLATRAGRRADRGGGAGPGRDRAVAGAGPAGRPARRRGRAQPARARAVHEPGQVAGPAAGRRTCRCSGAPTRWPPPWPSTPRPRWPCTPEWSRRAAAIERAATATALVRELDRGARDSDIFRDPFADTGGVEGLPAAAGPASPPARRTPAR